MDENEVNLRLLLDWMNFKVELSILKDKETSTRKQLYRSVFDDDQTGRTFKADFPELEGCFIANVPLNLKIDVDQIQLKEILQEASRNGAGDEILNGLFDWAPRVNESAYHALDPQIQQIINKALVMSPGMPRLMFKPYK